MGELSAGWVEDSAVSGDDSPYPWTNTALSYISVYIY